MLRKFCCDNISLIRKFENLEIIVQNIITIYNEYDRLLECNI